MTMSNLSRVSGESRDLILQMAARVQQGDREGTFSLYEKLSLPEARQQAVVKDILQASRLEKSPESCSSSQPSQKRAATLAKLPPVLDRPWTVLCEHNKVQNDALFQRAQAKALRMLVTGSLLEKSMGGAVKGMIFSFLHTQDLCAASSCSPELNYQVSREIPGVWQRLGKSYSIPERYWPNFSKTQCIANFRLIHLTNTVFDEYCSIGSPLVRGISKCSGVPTADLRGCKIQDPVERFVQHTSRIARLIIARDVQWNRYETIHVWGFKNTPQYLYGLMRQLAEDAPGGHPTCFLNLFMLSGESRGFILWETTLKAFQRLQEHTPEIHARWVSALELAANIPSKEIGGLGSFYRFFVQMTGDEKKRCGRLLTKVLSEKRVMESHDIGPYASHLKEIPHIFCAYVKSQMPYAIQTCLKLGPINDESPNNSLTVALKNKFSLAEIEVMCQAGAKPSAETFEMIEQYSADNAVKEKLLILLGGNYLFRDQ